MKPPPLKKTEEPDNNREFLVSDEIGNFFCGYRNGDIFWSNQITLARELTEEAHFNSLVRWVKGIKKLKKEYL
jgi:hypothetical protein